MGKTIVSGKMCEDGVIRDRDDLVIKSGFASLDAALGGGYPRGRLVDMFGPEGSGKTTLALYAIAQAQAAGGVAGFIDAEHDFNVTYAQAVGVDTTKLLVSQPDTVEQALDIAERLARSEVLTLIVVAVAMPIPETEEALGLQARLMSQALRKITAAAYRSGTTILFVHPTGQTPSTPGSNALKYYASVRLEVKRSGSRMRVQTVKNKMTIPFQVARFSLPL